MRRRAEIEEEIPLLTPGDRETIEFGVMTVRG